MNSIKEYLLNNKSITAIIILSLLLIVSFFYNIYLYNKEKIIYKDKIVYREKEKVEEFIYVDIKGYVKKPGVYQLEAGSRIIDLIDKSGGLIKDANTRLINLSKILNDEDNIVIYSNSEIKKLNKPEVIYKTSPCICEEVKNDGCIVEANDSLININTAIKEELMTLNGIGEAKANSIIEYRTNNGYFEKIEDIINVSGISENIFAGIKENITV